MEAKEVSWLRALIGMKKLLFPFAFNTSWPGKIKGVSILSWRMLMHRDVSEYGVFSRRDASIVLPLLEQGCSEPGPSPHHQKKGDDLTCLNIVQLIYLRTSSGFVRVYLFFPCSAGLSCLYRTLCLPLSIPCSDLTVWFFILFVQLYHKSLGFFFSFCGCMLLYI